MKKIEEMEQKIKELEAENKILNDDITAIKSPRIPQKYFAEKTVPLVHELLHQVIFGDFLADNPQDLNLALMARRQLAELCEELNSQEPVAYWLESLISNKRKFVVPQDILTADSTWFVEPLYTKIQKLKDFEQKNIEKNEKSIRVLKVGEKLSFKEMKGTNFTIEVVIPIALDSLMEGIDNVNEVASLAITGSDYALCDISYEVYPYSYGCAEIAIKVCGSIPEIESLQNLEDYEEQD